MPDLLPTEAHLFRVEGTTARLLGSRCPSCDESFFPRRWTCPVCLADVEDQDLSTEGVLYTYTSVGVPRFGAQQTDAEGYGVGQIDLPEGVRIQTVLAGDPLEWRIGATFASCLESVGVDEHGNELVVYRFAPVNGEEVVAGGA